jgi:ABC-type transport system involved in multi-copper enzyme maturation permease subunit
LAAKQFAAVAWLTMLEALRQPIGLLLAGTAILFTGLLPVLIMHQMGDPQKLVRDSALATHFVFGLLFAGYTACTAVQHELKRGTVSAVLVKPVGRELFFLAKYTGVAGVLVLFSVGLTTATLLAARMSAESYVVDWWAGRALLGAIGLAMAVALALNYFLQRPFVSTAFGWLVGFQVVALAASSFVDSQGAPVAWGSAVTWKLIPASVLVTLALLVLAGVAVAVATRFETVPTLAICSVVFLLGLMTDYLFGRVAGDSRLAAVLYAVLPNWQHFWLTDALSGDGTIPWRYVGRAAGYAALYLAGVLSLGMLAFRRTELPA